MSEIRIVQPISRADKKRLLAFPWEIYKDDPYWVPTLLSEEKGLLGITKDPFYDKNSIQPFLALKDNRVVGRIAAVCSQDSAHEYWTFGKVS